MKVFLVSFLFTAHVYAQQNDTLFLQRKFGEKIIAVDGNNTVSFEQSTYDSLGNKVVTSVKGSYMSQTKDSVTLLAAGYLVINKYKINSDSAFDSSVEFRERYIDEQEYTFAKKNVSDIIYYRYPNWNEFNRNVAWFSLAAGLIVAPLVSIDYKGSDFNQRRYLWTAGTALSVSFISFGIHSHVRGSSRKGHSKKRRYKLL